MNDRQRQLSAIYKTQDLWETAGYVPKSTLASALEANNLQAQKIKELEAAFSNSIQVTIKLEGDVHGNKKIIEALEQSKLHYKNLYAKERDEHASTKLALHINIESTQLLRDENTKLTNNIEFRDRIQASEQSVHSCLFHSRERVSVLEREVIRLTGELGYEHRKSTDYGKQLNDLAEEHQKVIDENDKLLKDLNAMIRDKDEYKSQCAEYIGRLQEENSRLIAENSKKLWEDAKPKAPLARGLKPDYGFIDFFRVGKPIRFTTEQRLDTLEAQVEDLQKGILNKRANRS